MVINHKNSDKLEYKGINFGEFFIYGTDKNTLWQFYNPVSRNWEFLDIIKRSEGNYKHAVILRDGWIIRKVGTSRKIGFYYYCKNNTIETIKKNSAEIKCIEFSLNWKNLKAIKKDKLITLNLDNTLIPSVHFALLLQLIEIKLPKNQWMDQLTFSIEKLKTVEKLLRKTRIKIILIEEEIKDMNETESNDKYDYFSIIPDICKLAYSDYLKKESRIEDFIIDISNERWSNFKNDELQQKLLMISTNKNQDNFLKLIYDFLLDKLPLKFDWKDLASTNQNSSIVKGINIESNEMEYQQSWSMNYFKASFPDLENSFYIPTTLAPNYKGSGKINKLKTRLISISMKKWRLYPYFGKMINTGTKEDFVFEEGNPDLLEESFNRIIGIPSIERILVLQGYIDSFNVDLAEWKGSYILNRQFLANVRLLNNNLDLGSKVPSTLVEDIFGNRFSVQWDLDTYFHYKTQIHNFQRNGWLSVLLINEFSKKAYKFKQIPHFKAVEFIRPKFITKDVAFQNNFLALVKYFRCLSLEEISDFWDLSIMNDVSYLDIMEFLLNNSLLFLNQNDKRLYYNYSFTNKDQLTNLINSRDNFGDIFSFRFTRNIWYKKYALLFSIFPIIHPLSYSKGYLNVNPSSGSSIQVSNSYTSLLDLIGEIRNTIKITFSSLKERRRSNFKVFDDSIVTYVGDKEIDSYISHITYNLKKYGQSIVAARGRFVRKASSIVKQVNLYYSYIELTISREDKLTSHNNKDIPEVNFKISVY